MSRPRHKATTTSMVGALLLGGALSACSGTDVTPAPRALPSASTSASPTPPVSGLQLQAVAEGFERPTYVAFAPDDPDTFYVVERGGKVYAQTRGTTESVLLLDLAGSVGLEGEEGLLSLAFHPEFQSGAGRFYIYFNDRKGDINIVEYSIPGSGEAPVEERRVFFVDKPDLVSWHNGGQLQFGPDNLLYFGTGDAARNPLDGRPNPPEKVDPRNQSQDLNLPFGKLFRIDVDKDAGEPEMVGYGLRNPWRFSFDRRTGELYIGDVGQFEWEEVDRADVVGDRPLLNFGWSAFEGRRPFERDRLNPAGDLVDPVAVYPHDPGPTYCPGNGSIVGGYVYRGTAMPDMAGRYIYGDFCSSETFSFDASTRRVSNSKTHASASVPQIVSFAEDPNGELYAISVSEGTIYHLIDGR